MSTATYTAESRMLIDGELVDASGGRRFENINPATEEVIGEVADASHEDMQRAIRAARRAFDQTEWSTDRDLRRRVLQQFQSAIEDDLDEMREEIIAEAGAPRQVTFQLDVPLIDGLKHPRELIETFPWHRRIADSSLFGINSRREVWKEPIGVVGAITPWNYPFETSIHKLGQALATGNTVVHKPAPDTPFNATRLARLFLERTDAPAGVLNVVTSSDHLVGEELTLSPLVDMISFTGSTATGQRIIQKGAETLKRVFLELGGKSAMIVLDDADFGAVLPSAAGICMHAGQGCSLLSRILLPRSRYEEGLQYIVDAMASVPYGDPQDSTVLMGPVVSRRQLDRVLGLIETGKAEGARCVLGGGRSPRFEKGYFVEPTVFADVDNSMQIARKEVFGPVLAVIPFDDDADAVRIANDSEYGLSGAVFSASPERADAIARNVRTGSFAVNGGVWYGADMPYGGYKMSGSGRQGGIEGFEQYLETKGVAWA